MNDIFDVTRIDNNVMNPFKENVALTAVFSNLITQLQPALDGRNVTVEQIGLDAMPTLKADNSMLEKLFYHLLVNAIKYTPDGGCITIQACVSGAGDEAKIVVADTGIGIDPTQLELIFEKFYQTGKVNLHSSGTTTFKGGGPGLGLAIAQGVVDAHNGRIWAESSGFNEEEYPGSQFHVCLPLK
jgi:signal transduction histidine kinase